MKVASGFSRGKQADEAIEQIRRDLNGCSPGWIVAYLREDCDAERTLTQLRREFPDAAIMGGTSCRGVLHNGGHINGDAGGGLGLFAVHDPTGAYGVGARPLKGDIAGAVEEASDEALARAGRPYETPALVWCCQAPGQEEAILSAVAATLGPNTPVIGGSSADDAVAGRWRQFADDRVLEDHLALGVLFPSGRVGYAFESGYTPTEKRGTVTRSDGRMILEIDGRSAREVYDSWTDGLVGHAEGSVLMRTTMAPLGRMFGEVGGVPHYLLSHPDSVTAQGALTTFSKIERGDEVVLMQGNEENLVNRAGRVVQDACRVARIERRDIAGGLLIYCAGCMLTVESRMNEVAASVDAAMAGAPFVGAFTFGEEGCFRSGKNLHGNLMISAVVFEGAG